MSSSFRERGNPPGARPEAPGKATPAAPQAAPFPNWLDRMDGVRARHDAITRNLNTWSNYKNWAERMRNAWDEGQENEAPREAPADDPGSPNH